jgi:hypothetical protein
MEQKGYAMYTASFGEFNYKNHTNISHLRRAINPIQDVLALVQLVRLIKRLKPHIVHTHTPKAGLLGMFVVWICMIPEKIGMQVCFLVENSKYYLESTGVVSITDELEYVGHRGQNALCPTLHQLITKEVGVTHAAIIGRKSWFLRNPYDESLKVAQDFSLWITAAAKDDFNIKVIVTPLYYYREEGNVSAVKMLQAYKYERKIILKYTSGFQKIKLWIKSKLKSVLVTILSTFGLMYLLFQKRATVRSDVNVINRLNADVLSIRNIKLLLKSKS